MAHRNPISVIIVDDNESFRKAFRKLLTEEYGHKVVGESASGEDFLQNTERYKANLVFLDLFMPGRNGIEIASKALAECPYLRFIAVTMHSEQAYLSDLIEAGFRGVIAKPRLFDELEEAIDIVMSDSYYFPNYIAI